jgi:PAS domain S-box-containing protein
MGKAVNFIKHPISSLSIAVLLVVAWTAIVMILLLWAVVHERSVTLELARERARTAFTFDQELRTWAAAHGGIYVPTDYLESANPYLEHVEEHDIMTPAGKRLMLMNPACMVQLLIEDRADLFGLEGGITSLQPLSPANAPDAWERAALSSLERSRAEVSDLATVAGEPYLRLMRPLEATQDCLLCHAHQGHKAGDVLGGVTVSVPLTPLHLQQRIKIARHMLSFGVLWLLGMVGIALGNRLIRTHLSERRQAEEALRENELRFRTFIDQAGDALFLIDPVTAQLVDVNQQACRSLGYSREELLTLTVPDFDPVFQAEKLSRFVRDLREKDEPLTLQTTYQRKDGTAFPVEARAGFVEAQGKSLVLALARDISERKQAEDELRDSEERLKRFYDAAFEGICITDKGMIVDSNNRFAEIFGYSKDELIGREVAELIFPEDKQFVTRMQKEESEEPYEHRAVHRDGSTLYFEVRGQAFPLEGKIVRATAIHDITQRKRSEQARRDKEVELDSLLSNVDAIVLEGDPFDIYYVGGQVERVLGYPREMWYGDTDGPVGFWSKHLHPDDTDKVKLCGEAIGRGEAHSFEYRMIAADGRVVWFYDTVTVETENGKPVKARSIMIDITERVEAETKVRAAEQELKQYSSRLEEMVEKRTAELEQAHEQLLRKERLTVMGRLAGGVAHELRNPLGVIANAGYFLKVVAADENETVREYLDIIAAEVGMAERIISDLLYFSRTRQAEKESTRLGELLSEVLVKNPPPDGVAVLDRIPDSLPEIFADRQQISIILVNLFTNAYDAMPEGGELKIRADVDQGRVRLDITDNGVGIPEDYRNKIFEPLFTTKTRGFGLGLAVTKNLVEANGGDIAVESRKDCGTTFTLSIPACVGCGR